MLILLHGFTGAPSSFRATREYLGTSPLAAPLLPGHGGTEGPRSLEDAFRVIDEARGGEPAHLAGYSMGGRLALHYALARREAVTALTLFGARPGIEDERARHERLESDRRWAETLRSEGLDTFLSQWEALPLLQPQSSDPAAKKESSDIRRTHESDGLANAMEAFSVAALPDLWPRLGELAVKVQWVAGQYDAVYVGLMERASQSVGTFHTIPDAGHSVLVDNPRAVAGVIRQV
ncbi:MAG: alpha/beta fold hydrolase [Myxococcota bacterium]